MASSTAATCVPDDGLFIDPADRDTFSLYAQFADMGVDLSSPSTKTTANRDTLLTQDTALMPDPLFSSPRSEIPAPGSSESKASRSTAHTTPLRNELYGRPNSPLEEHPTYMRLLGRCQLPTRTIQNLSSWGYQVLHIGQLICSNPPAVIEDANTSEIAICSNQLYEQLRTETNNCQQQVENLKWLKSLAAFNVFPGDREVCSNYKQRRNLIDQHIKNPKHAELKILGYLGHVYDAYVHHPYLVLTNHAEIDPEVGPYVAKLYHAIATLGETYYTWSRSTKDLKERYIEPLEYRIENTEICKREWAEWDDSKAVAHKLLTDPDAPGMAKTVSQGVVDALKKSAAKRSAFLASKLTGRFRRHATA